MKCFIRIKAVTEKVGFGKSKVWELTKEGEFPQPIKLTAGTTVWIEEEVDQWIDEQINKFRETPVSQEEPARRTIRKRKAVSNEG